MTELKDILDTQVSTPPIFPYGAQGTLATWGCVMAPLTIPRERGLVWGTPAMDASMSLLAIRVFNRYRRRDVATLPDIRKRTFTPWRDALTCDRCHKPTGRGPHECTWAGGPRPIGLSRERINIDSIDRRIMVRQWALEGHAVRRDRACRERGRGCMLQSVDGKNAVLVFGDSVNPHRSRIPVDAALWHEAEEWANARKKP